MLKSDVRYRFVIDMDQPDMTRRTPFQRALPRGSALRRSRRCARRWRSIPMLSGCAKRSGSTGPSARPGPATGRSPKPIFISTGLRRRAQRRLQLPRPAPGRARRQGRDDLRRRRAGRRAHAHLSRAARARYAASPTRSSATASRKGDRVMIYMPMIPEAAVAMLACARIGAVHSVVFGGFSPDSLADRIDDCGARIVITADEGCAAARRSRSSSMSMRRCAQSADGARRSRRRRRTGATWP